MPAQVQFSEKVAAPQPFKEPENMTTIELHKTECFSDGKCFSERVKLDLGFVDVKNGVKNEADKKFKVYNIIKSLLMMIGIFILLGLCVTILILLIHRGL